MANIQLNQGGKLAVLAVIVAAIYQYNKSSANRSAQTSLNNKSNLKSDFLQLAFDEDVKNAFKGFSPPNFLNINNVSQLYALSSNAINDLRNGVYSGIRLLGYYEKGDTIFPVNYYVSTSEAEADGGSIFKIGNIKLETKEPLNIFHFGGKSSFEFDSFPAFKKLVDYCNKYNYIVKPKGKFKFVSDGSEIIILTDVDLKDSELIFDCNHFRDFKINIRPRLNVFNSLNLEENICKEILLEIQTVINNKLVQLTGAAKDFLSNKFCCLRILGSKITNEYIETNRLGVNRQTWYKEETFYCDSSGYIEGDFYNDTIELINSSGEICYYIEAFDNRESRSFNGAKNIKFVEDNYVLSSSNYRQIGFYFEGICNLKVTNIIADLSNIKNKIFGFVRLLKCYNVTLQNYNSIPVNFDSTGGASTYMLNITECANVSINKYVNPSLLDPSMWGSICGHRSFNITFRDCTTNRIDCHYRGFDWTIDNCKIGSKGITFSGGGIWNISKTAVYRSQNFMAGRSDYASEFKGEIFINDCVLYTLYDDNNAIVNLKVANDSDYNYLMHPNDSRTIEMVRKIHVNGFKASNRFSTSLRQNCRIYGLTISEGITQNVKIPSLYLNNISAENISNNDPNLTRVSACKFPSTETLYSINQGDNGCDVIEASEFVKPSFKEKYNWFIHIENSNLGNYTSDNLISVNNVDISHFNERNIINQYPLPLITVNNCRNVVPLTSVYRAQIQIIASSVISKLTCYSAGVYTYNKVSISNSTYFRTSNFMYPFYSTASPDGDIKISDCILDCNEDVNDASLLSWLFRHFSSGFTPTPIVISSNQNCFNNHLSQYLNSRLQGVSDFSISQGYSGFNPSLVKFSYQNGRNGFIDKITNISDIPKFVNLNILNTVSLLYYGRSSNPGTGSKTTVLYWDSTKGEFIDKKGNKGIQREFGTTAQRPLIENVNIGYCYFDTTLSKPIYNNGTNWIDYLGNIV